MSQLGSGNASSYPDAIDTRQVFLNGPMMAPDSASRLDSEVLNDLLHAVIQVETTLGARPQGDFASVAARLQQVFPGGGGSSLGFGFAATTSVTIPGTVHNLGTANPLLEIYDNQSPRRSIEPNTVVSDSSTYDLVVTFITPQSGIICLANPVPQYSTTFTAVTSVSIPGTSHSLGTALLFASVYLLAGGEEILTGSAAVTIHPGTYDVVVTFSTPQSGRITLSAAGPRYSTTFTSQTSVTVLGATHGLGIAALLYQLYDAATPRRMIEPNSLTVDQSTYDVVVTFNVPQSGTLLLVAAGAISGQDFQLRDQGITNVNATRVYSANGALQLQMGSGNILNVQNATGGVVESIDNLGNLAITGNASKPGGGSWLSVSDERLKTAIRPFTDGLASLLALEPVWFKYNGKGGIRADGQDHVSLLAQAAQQVAPYLVGTEFRVLDHGDPATELLTLDTSPLVYLLLNAVKTLYQTHLAQEARLARLEALVLPPEEPPA